MTQEILIALIRCRLPRRLDKARIEAHRASFEQGDDVMPIDVLALGDGTYRVAGNGRHRLAGARAAGMDVITCRVRQ